MKKIKFIILAIASFFTIANVNAESYVDKFLEFSQWIPNTYIVQQKGTTKRYQQMSVIKRVSDGKWSYCIEPGISMTTAYMEGYDYDQALMSGISDTDWDRIVLIAYYGYNYIADGYNHTDLKWYAVGQMLIWRTVNNGYDIYFTNSLNGNRINKYETEMQEIENLISEHYKRPSFNNQTLTLNLNESITLSDSNNVLSKFNITNHDGLNVSKNGNELTISPNRIGSSVLNLEKKDTKHFSLPIAYVSSTAQNIMTVGDYDPIKIKLNINVYNAKVKIIKIDSKTNEVINKNGIKFKIKNLDTNNYVCYENTCEYETVNGSFVTPFYLSMGTYQLEELDQKLDGYLWNSNPLKFTVNEHSQIVDNTIELKFTNEEVKGSVSITKYGEKLVLENGTYFYEKILLSDVAYHLYASENIYNANNKLIYKKDTLIKTVVIKKGTASIDNLYLGKYYLVESKTSNNHILDDTKYYFELSYKDQHTSIIKKDFQFNNYLPKSEFELSKIDVSTGKSLPNTLIEIYLINDNNEEILMFAGRTDEFGKIIVKNLPLGNYFFIEKEAPVGYNLNEERMLFQILENNEIVKAIMTNEQIPVEIPNTFLSKNIIFDIVFTIGCCGLLIATIIYNEKKKK